MPSGRQVHCLPLPPVQTSGWWCHRNPATGTIRVALYDSAKDKALSGGQLTLYRVAEVKRKNGDLSFEYCGDFTAAASRWVT